MSQNKTKNSKSPKNGTLDPDNIVHREYLNVQRKSYTQDVKTSDAEANETDRVLSNQLILITTVLITANIVFLGNKELLASLTLAQRFSILCGLGLLMISLMFGIRYYQEIRKFHKRWAKSRQKVVDIVHKVKAGTYFYDIDQAATRAQKLDPHVDETFLKYQIHCLYGALGVYFLLVMALVFDFGFLKTIFDAANPCMK